MVLTTTRPPNKDELTKELLQNQTQGTDIYERTAGLYSEQGNTDISELMVIDEMTQCDISEEHYAKGKCPCRCGTILRELSAGTTETLKENDKTSYD